jgi:hypothetical protein
MTRLTQALVGVLAVGGIAASLVIQQAGRAKLSVQAEASRKRADQIAQLSAENESLSNLAARVGSPRGLPPDDLRELLKLRGQIGLLREAAREQAQLETANQQLRAVQADYSEQQLAAARAAPNFWAKEQLTFAGYGDPEATLKSMLWAINSGDIKSFLACLAPGSEVAAQLSAGLANKPEAELAALGKEMAGKLAPSIGFRIIRKQVNSADEVVLNLSFDGEGKTRRFVAKKAGSEWKLAGFEEP